MKRENYGRLVDAFLVPEVVNASLLQTGSLLNLLLLLDLLDHPLGWERSINICLIQDVVEKRRFEGLHLLPSPVEVEGHQGLPTRVHPHTPMEGLSPPSVKLKVNGKVPFMILIQKPARSLQGDHKVESTPLDVP